MSDINNLLAYLLKARTEAEIFLDSLTVPGDLNRFYFCKEGYMHPTSGKGAHFTTSFAVRIAQQSGIWASWDENRRASCINFINSFQTKEGFFVDEWLHKRIRYSVLNYLFYLIGRRIKPLPLSITRQLNLYAETRQDFPIILNSGNLPPYPAPLRFIELDDARKFFGSLDWEQPWAAGSHFSHQLVFLAINHQYYQLDDKRYNSYINLLLNLLESIRDPLSGTWFKGNPRDNQKVNGAMKVLSGLQWIDRPYPDCTNLYRFALSQEFILDGCNFFNPLFVIYHCVKSSPGLIEKRELEVFLLKVLEIIERFRKNDHGFSFQLNKAQTKYYGVTVSRGLRESDLHGTSMMIWAMSVVAELLRLMGYSVPGWKVTIN